MNNPVQIKEPNEADACRWEIGLNSGNTMEIIVSETWLEDFIGTAKAKNWVKFGNVFISMRNVSYFRKVDK